MASILRTRRDKPGALVALVDGRFAVTGPYLIVGGPRAIVRYIRERVNPLTTEEQEQAWWQEVAGVLANPARRTRGARQEGRDGADEP